MLQARVLRLFVAAGFLLLLLLQAFSSPLLAQSNSELEYSITIKNPVSHLYDVELDIHGSRESNVSLFMPAWEPGVYSIRDFAKNVQNFRAFTGRNQALASQQTDKQTWRITKQPADDVVVRYEVFSNQLNDELADISGAAVFMYLVGHKDAPVSVKYSAPNGWKVFTALEGRGDRYRADNYDSFIAAPVFIGEGLKVLEFESNKVRYRVVFSKSGLAMTEDQVTSDISDLVDASRSLFQSGLPYKTYTFLVKVQPNTGSTGVAYPNSARITVGENDFVNDLSYKRFLFTAVQSLLHAWIGIRIQPVAFVPLDYSREATTRLLWLIDGATDYYANLLLVRTGIQDQEDWYFKLSDSINTFEHAPGHSLVNVEDASWNVWLHSDNSENNSISYAARGEVLALFLDLDIRQRTKGQKSLDDVMRVLWTQYGSKNAGMSDDAFQKTVESVTGADYREFFEVNVHGKKEPDYNQYFNIAALQVQIDHQAGTIYAGIEMERMDSGQARVRRPIPGSPAEHARIDTGDILVSLNNDRITYDNFRIRLHSHRLGEALKLTVLRGERLLTLDLTPVEYQEERWTVVDAARTTPEELDLRKVWLGPKN